MLSIVSVNICVCVCVSPLLYIVLFVLLLFGNPILYMHFYVVFTLLWCVCVCVSGVSLWICAFLLISTRHNTTPDHLPCSRPLLRAITCTLALSTIPATCYLTGGGGARLGHVWFWSIVFSLNRPPRFFAYFSFYFLSLLYCFMCWSTKHSISCWLWALCLPLID